uniref:dymeclin isoform X2 n=1 Tax=Myxine glutinosa TaxID=7769 RepID=UPI00358EEEA2
MGSIGSTVEGVEAESTCALKDLDKNVYLLKLAGPSAISHNDPFWNQLLSFTFPTPTSSADAEHLERETVAIVRDFVANNPRTGNFAALAHVFIARTKELKISADCANDIFIWQTHNALFIMRCILKVFVSCLTEEEMVQHFTFLSPGSPPDEDSQFLLEDVLEQLFHVIIDVPHMTITYAVHLEAVTAMLVLLSVQLKQNQVLQEGPIYHLFTRGRSSKHAGRLVKALLYNFIRREAFPSLMVHQPPALHHEGSGVGAGGSGGLLYDLASGVATGLWTVLTLGAGTANHRDASSMHPGGDVPLANQSLLLLLGLTNLGETEEVVNPYRAAIVNCTNTQGPVPPEIHTFQINFSSLFGALCVAQDHDAPTLLLYLLLHYNSSMRTFVLARTDIENLVLPIAHTLYCVEENNSQHVYMSLIVLLILSEDDTFNASIHEVMLSSVSWYTERSLADISVGSLLILVLIRTVQFNMTRTRDKYLHTNCLAVLANMSAHFRGLHQYAAQRIVSLLELLSRKHSKVLEQATQSTSPALGADGTGQVPDYAQDVAVVEEVMRMILEVVGSCVSGSLQHNPNLLYTLLYKRELFQAYRLQPAFADVTSNIHMVLEFFGARLEQAGSGLTVEQVQAVIKQGAMLLPKEKLTKFPELRFRYVEEENPAEFFVPYIWSLVYRWAYGLWWPPEAISLFPAVTAAKEAQNQRTTV